MHFFMKTPFASPWPPAAITVRHFHQIGLKTFAHCLVHMVGMPLQAPFGQHAGGIFANSRWQVV
jgi:hypothetical protein